MLRTSSSCFLQRQWKAKNEATHILLRGLLKSSSSLDFLPCFPKKRKPEIEILESLYELFINKYLTKK